MSKARAKMPESQERAVALKISVMEKIRERIMDGRYALGQRLSENILAQEMNTSRAPVHDALLMLRNQGLVQIFPQRGSFVFNPTPEEMLSLCDVSGVYEMGALALAMEHAHEELCRALEDALARCRTALEKENRHAWTRADRLFHESIVRVAGNQYLAQAYQGIVIQTAALVFHLPSDPAYMKVSQGEHENILEFIKKHDFDNAAKLLRANNHKMTRQKLLRGAEPEAAE